MTVNIRLKTGNKAKNDLALLPIGSMAVDVENKCLRLHDGITVGGHTIVKSADIQSLQTQLDDLNVTSVDALDLALAAKMGVDRLGVAEGAATLTASGQIPASQLPSFVDDIEEYDGHQDLPLTGEYGKLYIVLDADLVYRWDGVQYAAIASVPESIDDIAEGGVNLYYSDTRVRGSFSADGDVTYDELTGEFSFSESINSVEGQAGDVVITKTDVELDLLENYAPATQSEAELAAQTDRYQTTLASRQMLESTGLQLDNDSWVFDIGSMPPAYITGNFTHLSGAFGGVERKYSAIALHGDRVYRLAGRDVNNDEVNEIHWYDIKTKQSGIATGIMAPNHFSYSAAAEKDDKIYMVSGLNAAGNINKAFGSYDPVNDLNDVDLGDFNRDFRLHRVLNVNGDLYIVGGNNNGDINKINIGDVTANVVSGIFASTVDNVFGAAVGDWIYVFERSTVFRYNVVTQELSQVVTNGIPLPTVNNSGRYTGAIGVEGKIYILGGTGYGNELWVLDTETNEVSKLGAFPVASPQNVHMVEHGGSIYAYMDYDGLMVPGLYKIA